MDFQKIIRLTKCATVHCAHHGEHFVHTVYFGLVTLEAHGRYRYAAGMLCAGAVIRAVTHVVRHLPWDDKEVEE